MRKTLTVLLLMLITGFSSGCASTPEKQEPGFILETLARGAYSGLTVERMEATSDAAAYAEYWRRINRGEPPAVDFAEEMVIIAALGERRTGGYSIEVTVIEPAADALRVYVLLRSPGPQCMTTQALTQPYHIVKTRRSGKPVKFEVLHEVINC